MTTATFGALPAVNLEIFRRYAGLSLPRHVSYPMPTWWDDLGPEDVEAMYADGRRNEPANDLSLYLHIPFCESLCKYCACTRVIQPKSAAGAAEITAAYVSALEREIGWLARRLGRGRVLRQIHWGGGSPLYLASETIARVWRTIRKKFRVAADAEIAMEIDPRNASGESLESLRELGFNRVSLGVQDYNEKVQRHVHRVQPYELVRDVVARCRELGFGSVNFDLIYGLPYQTVETIRDTVERSVGLEPDRVAYYHYAQIPEKIATQRGLDYTRLPDSETKLQMFLLGAELFQAAGYEFIGLDHFARADELLAKAVREGTVQRNFQGMTTGRGLDLIGAGASSISHLGTVGFLQNVHQVDEYVARVERGETAVHRGKRFTRDDLIRQAVLNELYCVTEVDPARIEERFRMVFAEYFARELEILRELQHDGLVVLESDGVIRVTFPLGRVLLRTVGAVFDAYLESDAYRVGDRHCYSANA